MMVPRSYAHASPPPSPKMRYAGKDVPSVTAVGYAQKKSESRIESVKTHQAPQRPGIFAPPPSTPSKPVVIPTRTRHDGRRRSQGQVGPEQRTTRTTAMEHDQTAVSPSVTALLAMTSISAIKRSSPPSGLRRAFDGKRSEKRPAVVEARRHTLSSSNPQTWGFLMSPPSDEELDNEGFSSDTTIGPIASLRSLSTDSMPSLDEDDDESLCSASDPATPAMLAGSRGERKKGLSTSKGESCVMNHPLLPPPARSVNDNDEQPQTEMAISTNQAAVPQSKTSLKSNLTASFRAVRSAARSFSDWTMTSSYVSRGDQLSQSLLSLTLPYAVERRPLLSDDLPDPVTRRYLNPMTLSPLELHFHQPANEVDVKACIQLETYQRGNRPSQYASSPPIFPTKRQLGREAATDTEDSLTSSLLPRQREPRENGDFLRVVVLEMNMRKVGKLTGTNGGRAKLWLPARRVESKPAAVEVEGQAKALACRGGRASSGIKRVSLKKIPARWTAIAAV